MIRAELSDLRIVKMDSLGQVRNFFNMRICEEVVVFVVDNDGKLVGIISQKDYDNLKSECIEECINRTPIKVLNDARVEEIVRHMFYGGLCKNYVPVVDSENRLLYVYFDSKIKRLMKYDRNLAEGLVVKQYRYTCTMYPEKEVLILGNIEISCSPELRECMISIDDLPNLSDRDDVIILLSFYEAYEAMEVMQEIWKYNLNYIGNGSGSFRARKNSMENSWGTSDYMSLDRSTHEVLLKEYVRRGKYFCLPDMENICQALKTTKHLMGDYVEIGTFRGDSARVALRYMEAEEIVRDAYFFDTYEGFSYEEAKNSKDMRWNGTHATTSLELVKERLAEFDRVKCIRCNIIADGLPNEIENIAVCNIDVDMQEAVYAALNKVNDRMVSGGIIIAEDYGHMPELVGANYAVNQFIEENKERYTWLYLPSGQMFLIRR